MKKLRVGIIGMGIGEKHLQAFEKNRYCEIAMLCDFDASKLAEIKAKYPQYSACLDASEVISDPRINVLSIASYDNFHFAQTIAALEAGKHVYAEKPFCLYRAEADRIGKLLNAKRHLKFSSNLVLRTVPRFKELRKKIRAGELGPLFHLEGDYNYGRVEKLTNGWRGQIDFYSPVYGGGVHIVDLLHWLSGEKITEVQAIGNNISTKGTSFRYNDMVTALVKFENGMTGKISANFACVYPHFHKINIYGTKGTFEQDMIHANYYFSRDKDDKPVADLNDYPGHSTRGELIAGFIDAIVDDAQPLVTPQEVFDAMSVCFAIEDALKSGEKVKVSYMEVYK
jgi:predicted dehydrogenase